MMRRLSWRRRPGRLLVTVVLAVVACSMLMATLCCNLPHYTNKYLPLMEGRLDRYQSPPWGNSLRLQALRPGGRMHEQPEMRQMLRSSSLEPGSLSRADNHSTEKDQERPVLNEDPPDVPIFNYKREEIFHNDYPLVRRTDTDGNAVMQFHIQESKEEIQEDIPKVMDETAGDELYDYADQDGDSEYDDDDDDNNIYNNDDYDDDGSKQPKFKVGDFDLVNYTKFLFQVGNGEEKEKVLRGGDVDEQEDEPFSDYEDDYSEGKKKKVPTATLR